MRRSVRGWTRGSSWSGDRRRPLGAIADRFLLLDRKRGEPFVDLIECQHDFGAGKPYRPLAAEILLLPQVGSVAQVPNDASPC